MVTPEEWGASVANCMSSSGFSGRATSDGVFETGSIDPNIAPSYYSTLYVCEASYPIDPRYTRALNASQLAYLYAYYRDVLIGCLENQGYSTPELPSQQAFVDSYASTAWTPYAGIKPPTEAEWVELQAHCPQFPDGLY